jgi:hypothetical protein
VLLSGDARRHTPSTCSSLRCDAPAANLHPCDRHATEDLSGREISQAIDSIGGAEEDRTPDLCSAIAALSQLSYGP